MDRLQATQKALEQTRSQNTLLLDQVGEASGSFEKGTGETLATNALQMLGLRAAGAVRDMIGNYLDRYRVGLGQAATPPRIQQWYRRSIRNLTPLLARIDSQTLTYQDLSTILREMYSVYGEGRKVPGDGPISIC